MENSSQIVEDIPTLLLRKKQEQYSLEIRKSQRAEQLQIKRMLLSEDSELMKEGSAKDLKAERLKKELLMQAITYEHYNEILNSTRMELDYFELNTNLIFEPKNLSDNLKGLLYFRLVSSQGDIDLLDLIKKMYQNGALLKIIDFSKDPSLPPIFQYESTWVLGNFCSEKSQVCKVLLECGVVDIFFQLTNSPYPLIREQGFFGLGNLIAESIACRDRILDDPLLLETIFRSARETNFSEITENAFWVIWNISIKSPQPPYSKIEPFLRFLTSELKIIEAFSEKILMESLMLINNYFTKYYEECCNLLMTQEDFLSNIFRFAREKAGKVQQSAFKMLGTFTQGSDDEADFILGLGLLDLLKQHVASSVKELRHHSYEILTNLAGGSAEQGLLVMNHFYPLFLDEFKCGAVKKKKLIAQALNNMVKIIRSGDLERISDKNLAELLSLMLAWDQEEKVITLCIDTIRNIADKLLGFPETRRHLLVLFENFEGTNRLEKLQEHKNELIYNDAYNLILDLFESS